MINQKFDFKGLFGIFGVGALMILGVFFILNGTLEIWDVIEDASNLSGWSILVSIPLVVVSYIFGIIIIEIANFLFFSKRKKEEEKEILKILVEQKSEFLQGFYLEEVQNQRLLKGGAISFIFVGIGSLLESHWPRIGILGIIGGLGAFLISIICIILVKRMNKNMVEIITQFKDENLNNNA